MRKKYRIILILVLGAFLVIVVTASTPSYESGYAVTWRDELGWKFDLLMVKLHLRHGKGSLNSCIANLKQIDGAKATWALENKLTNTDIPSPTELYGATNYVRDAPTCPQGGTYVLGQVQQKPTCTIRGHTL